MSAAEGAAGGLAVALLLAMAGWPAPGALPRAIITGAALAAAGIVVRIVTSPERRTRVAQLVEQRAPQCRNLVVTADEMRPGVSVGEQIAALIYTKAAQLVRGLDPAKLFPARNAIVALVVSAALWTMAITRVASGHSVLPATPSSSGVASIDGIDVVVTSPAYAARRAQTLHDPARIEALVGSRVRITVRAHAARVAVETLNSHDTLTASTNGAFTTELTADADGYVALEPSFADGRAGVRRLIGFSVIPDEAPRVRIAAPGKDILLRDGHHTIDLAIEASDDIGLASLRVRYTKVSGSGERFTFSEGEVPIQVTRANERTWTARARWPLDGLELDAGDMVVYRAVATDHRPGATPSESDSYIAEILAPGGNAAPGFALDPDQERYAVSQQMVILKSERLAARKATMSADAYATESQDIGGEQRKVRAEFVFMMGGELADAPDPNGSLTDLNEEAEAQGEDDLLAGRSANQGRIALLRAIRAMSRASTALTIADLTTALTHERAALAQLELAFSRTRIILRALTERERLDLSRRLTGVLTDAARDAHPSTEPAPDARVTSLRRALSGIAELAGTQRFGADASARASILAESVLRVDPSAKPLQEVAAQLNAAAAALGHSRIDDARAQLDRAATGIAAALRTDLPPAPQRAPSLGLDRLDGALIDALRNQRVTR